MQPKNLFFLMQYIIYCHRYNIVFGKPMFGANVRDVEVGEFPFIVALRRINVQDQNPTNYHLCTGSLVTKQDVLTAAHCFEDEILQHVKVIVGTVDLSNGIGYNISWWITYNEWAAAFEVIPEFRANDIANIRLTQLVCENIDLGVLSQVPIKDVYGKEVIIAAWGRNEQNITPVRMRTVEVTAIGIGVCQSIVKRLHGRKIKIHSRHICTRAIPHAVIYWGDSGGPLLYLGLIIAVNKSTIPFPNEPLNPRKLNVHTTISYYRHFIDSVIDPEFRWI